MRYQPGQQIIQMGHKLCSEKVPSKYEIQFVRNEVRYAYGFSIRGNAILDEYLYYFPKGRQVKIFERVGLEIKAGDEVEVNFDTGVITDKTTGKSFQGQAFPPFMQKIIDCEGLVNYINQK